MSALINYSHSHSPESALSAALLLINAAFFLFLPQLRPLDLLLAKIINECVSKCVSAGMSVWVSACVRAWISAFMFNYSRRSRRQTGASSASATAQETQLLCCRWCCPRHICSAYYVQQALHHNQATSIYVYPIYTMAASVRLRRAQIAFAFKLFAPISRYEIFFIYIFPHICASLFLGCKLEGRKTS